MARWLLPAVALVSIFTLALVFAGCKPDFYGNIPCLDHDECPTGYYCNAKVCAKGQIPTAPVFQVDRLALNYGEIQASTDGSIKSTLSVVVKNISITGGPISVKGVLKTDDVPSPFSLMIPPSPPEGQYVKIEADATQTFSVTYAPTAIGDNFGYLVISDQDTDTKKPDNPGTGVQLSGSGTDPNFQLDPATIDFGIAYVGGKKDTRTVLLKNTADKGSVTVTNIHLMNSSEVLSVDTGGLSEITIEPGGSYPITITLDPKQAEPNIANKVSMETTDKDALKAEVTILGTVSGCSPGSYWSPDLKTCCEWKYPLPETCAGAKELVVDLSTPTLVDTDGRQIVITEGSIPGNESTIERAYVYWATFISKDNYQADLTTGKDVFHTRIVLETKDPNILMDVYTIRDYSNREKSSFVCNIGDKFGEYKCDAAGCSAMQQVGLSKYHVASAVHDQMDFRLDLSIPVGGTMVCGTTSVMARYFIDALAGLAAGGINIGECPCMDPEKAKTEGSPPVNICHDDTQRFYIKLYRKTNTPVTCDTYKLTISNTGSPDCKP